MHAAVAWFIAGLAALTVEMATGTFFLLFVGLACLAAALVALTGSPGWTWLTFLTAAAGGILLVRPRAVGRLRRAARTATNVDALIGRRALLVLPFDPLTRVGRVRVGAEEWRAVLWEGADSTDWPAGTACWVQGVEGATLVVVPDAASAPRGALG